MRKLAAGNWKMNGLAVNIGELESLADQFPSSSVDILICPPATLLTRMAQKSGAIALGGQDCHPKSSGAHTGDISAEMIKDTGARYVILGHSERRADHGESDALIHDKCESAWGADLCAIVCVGETLEDREAGKTLDVVGAQLAGSIPAGARSDILVVAYEPVWAIGTGKVPTPEQIAEVHQFLRTELTNRFGETGAGVRLLYGGSVKASNASEIFAIENVDGALVGGASLAAADFSGIITALEASIG